MQIAELTAYLTAILPDFYLIGTPRPLQGGLLNMVWRQTALPHNLVVKYAPPHIATAPEVPMDSRRSHFEAQALVWLEQNSEHLPPDVRPPRLIYADPDRALIVMEDLGDGLDLVAAWQTLRSDQVQSQAIRIARFLAQLHLKSFQDPKLAQEFDNTGVQNVRLQVQYNLFQPLQEAG